MGQYILHNVARKFSTWMLSFASQCKRYIWLANKWPSICSALTKGSSDIFQYQQEPTKVLGVPHPFSRVYFECYLSSSATSSFWQMLYLCINGNNTWHLYNTFHRKVSSLCKEPGRGPPDADNMACDLFRLSFQNFLHAI